jgi:hypothetical protein
MPPTKLLHTHPENPEFSDWQLDKSERYKPIAVFFRVLGETLN